VLSLAEMDDRTQPDFGKAKIRALAEQQELFGAVFQSTSFVLSLTQTVAASGEGHPEERPTP
jgi:hypothetical protein